MKVEIKKQVMVTMSEEEPQKLRECLIDGASWNDYPIGQELDDALENEGIESAGAL